jgi:hypothetical protein
LYQVDKTSFKVTAIYDFNDVEVFKNVSTRYGLFHLIRNQETTFPIPYYRYENNQWQEYFASTFFHKADPLSISKEYKVYSKNDLPKIILKKESTPRQGVNTCGANDVSSLIIIRILMILLLLFQIRFINKLYYPKNLFSL